MSIKHIEVDSESRRKTDKYGYPVITRDFFDEGMFYNSDQSTGMLPFAIKDFNNAMNAISDPGMAFPIVYSNRVWRLPTPKDRVLDINVPILKKSCSTSAVNYEPNTSNLTPVFKDDILYDKHLSITLKVSNFVKRNVRMILKQIAVYTNYKPD
jgi:hypothetical protein